MQGATPPPQGPVGPPGSMGQPAAPQGPVPVNMNPVTNPTHPAHVKAARHMGAAIAHIMLGNGEHAAHHLGQAIGHVIAPHMPDQHGAIATAAIKDAAHGGAKPEAKPKKSARKGRKK